jgi:hypothetical protein
VGAAMLARVVVAGLSTCMLVVAACLIPSSNAQAQAPATSTGDCFMWIDAATGKRLPTTPVGTPSFEQGGGGAANLTGRAHLTNGVNAFRDADGNWINSATGTYLPTTPVGTPSVERGGGGAANLTGQAHLTNGVNAVRVPCPPPASEPSSAQSSPQTQPPPDTGSSAPGGFGFGIGVGGFGSGQDRGRDSGRRP